MSAPRLRFMIGGVQKAGTTALARYLADHPGLCLPTQKEAHVFDAFDYDELASAAEVDARFAPLFGACAPTAMYGDATPITLLHPRFIQRVRRYNPGLRWVVLLREPVARAISQYHMEHARGSERRSLLFALLAESWRLRGHADDFSPQSPLRLHSYVARGRYVDQLRTLYAEFPQAQVLLLRSQDLAEHPADTVAKVTAFLGVEPMPEGYAFARHFEGRYDAPSPWSPARGWLRWVLRHETRRLRQAYGVDLDGPAL